MVVAKEILWPEILKTLQGKLDKASYETWFVPAGAEWSSETELRLHVPSQFFQEWICNHYMDLLREVIAELAGPEIKLTIEVDEGSRKRWDDTVNALPPAQEDRLPPPSHSPYTYKPSFEILRGIPLSPRYIFETFIVGNSNRFACAASMAVAEKPSQAYNPLFIYGGVGLGKTHLLHAIGNSLAAHRPEIKVLYVSSEIFLNEMVRCLRASKMEDFRSCFRDVDVLLVDDIQFMEDKESMQQEFYHTFNSLFENSKQIVATSDSHPKDIRVSDKLRSRFEWGLTVDIQSPDLETRIAILKKKCELEHLAVPNDVLLLIAESMRSNIREMEGSLTRVAAYASLTRRSPDLEMANEVLKDVIKTPPKVISIERIQSETAANYNVKVTELRGKTRTANLVMCRQVAMYISRDLTNASLTEIGEAFGGKNHSTVIYAIEKVRELMEKNGTFIAQVNDLIRRIKS